MIVVYIVNASMRVRHFRSDFSKDSLEKFEMRVLYVLFVCVCLYEYADGGSGE